MIVLELRRSPADAKLNPASPLEQPWTFLNSEGWTPRNPREAFARRSRGGGWAAVLFGGESWITPGSEGGGYLKDGLMVCLLRV